MNLTLLDIILILMINGGSIYFAGYLKEKSKNKAVAEDISNITSSTLASMPQEATARLFVVFGRRHQLMPAFSCV